MRSIREFMEIYLKHPWVVWGVLGPIALVSIVGTLIFLVISLMPSSSVERLVARYTRKARR
jgi:hypothetical protein